MQQSLPITPGSIMEVSDGAPEDLASLSEERLYGLMDVAERQQAVVQTAIEGMVKDRIAFGDELRLFGERMASWEDEIRVMVGKAIEDTRGTTQQVGESAAQGVVEALKVVLDDLTLQAEQTQTALRSATRWVTWRFLGLALGGIVALAVLWWLASCAVVLWDTGAIGRIQVQKVQLQTELAGLEANRDQWVKAGMEAKLGRCGPKQRPCVKVDESAGVFGDHGDYRVVDTR